MNERTMFSYWLLTVGFLAISLLIFPKALYIAITINLAHAMHYFYREPKITSFPMQVRVGYLCLLMLGLVPYLGWLHWVQLIGGTIMLTTGYCPLARMLSLFPWNRNQPISWNLISIVVFTPPVDGCILKALPPRKAHSTST